MTQTKLRKKTCKAKGCTTKFTPWNSLHVACSTKCAIQITQAAKEKAERQRLKRDRERIKRKTDLTKEAQQAFNAYIRERDKDQPCISCGVQSVEHTRGGGWDCGHYRSIGACPELRFEELNAHKQCKQCNSYLSGNTVEYRIRLRMRIGDQLVDWLEGKHEPKKYTIEDLKEIKALYKQKKRELSGGRPGKASRNLTKILPRS